MQRESFQIPSGFLSMPLGSIDPMQSTGQAPRFLEASYTHKAHRYSTCLRLSSESQSRTDSLTQSRTQSTRQPRKERSRHGKKQAGSLLVLSRAAEQVWIPSAHDTLIPCTLTKHKDGDADMRVTSYGD